MVCGKMHTWPDLIHAIMARGNKVVSAAKSAKPSTKRCKRLKVSTVSLASKAIQLDQTAVLNLNSVKASKHLIVFPQMKRFCELLDRIER